MIDPEETTYTFNTSTTMMRSTLALVAKGTWVVAQTLTILDSPVIRYEVWRNEEAKATFLAPERKLRDVHTITVRELN